MASIKIDATKFAKTPFCIISIHWTVDGSSGSTQCEAWRGQFEIDQLIRAGYTILSIGRA